MSETVQPQPIQEPVSVDDNASSLTIDDGGGAITVDGTVTAELSAVDNAVLDNIDADLTTIIGHVDGLEGSLSSIDADTTIVAGAVAGTEMQVDVVAALPTGDNNIGNVDIASIAAGDTNIGNVDIVTVPAPLSTTGGGTEATALRVTLASDSTGVVSVDDNGGALTVDGTVTANLAAGTNTNEVVGDVAHSAGVAGNPLLIAGVSQDQDDSAPPNRVDAEADTTRLATDRDGALFVRPFGPQVWSYHENSSSALTDTSVHGAPGSGLSLYVTDIVCSTGSATAFNIFFEEGASTVLGPYYLEAVAGRGLAIHFNTPKKITANTALTVTTSAAIAHSIDVTGYVAQG